MRDAQHWREVAADALGKGVASRIVIHPSHGELYEAVARDLMATMEEAERLGRRPVVVFPVGPIPLRALAGILNEWRVSCRGLAILLMDEYCESDGEMVPATHPLSLRGCFWRDFMGTLMMPPREEDVVVPDPRHLDDYGRRIAEMGGIDVVYTGFGINGHWAFNEPAASDQECCPEAYRELSTRVVSLSCETVTQMAIGGTGGDVLAVPPKAVTIGPRELLSARELYCLGVRTWHSGVLRRALHGPITGRFPASLVQLHTNVTLAMVARVAERPEINVLQRL
jgi:glucosamine-6-phosphate deaminase